MRVERGLTLARLAEGSGVSKAMLSQVELGQSVPTISVLWKIARTLNVPFSALLGNAAASRSRLLLASKSRLVTSRDGSFTSRALFPNDQAGVVEFFELHLARGAIEEADPHPAGSRENLVVHQGQLELTVDSTTHDLGPGDAMLFHSDVPHRYRNTGKSELVMYLVVVYTNRSSR
jgi:transcriptional regulator with XRE-family HTH domain